MGVTSDAQTMLEAMLGKDAEFKDGQLEAIVALAQGRRRVLVVQQTGWGKSAVYFIATRLLRDEGLGPTILISPLLALMRDQVRMAEKLGVRAATLNSGNPSEWGEIEAQLAADEIDILMVSPERLANERFRAGTLASIPKGIGLFVVDEAHCISDWGHDFRPDYRRIQRITELLPANVPLLATTATANNRVVTDVEEQLGPELMVVRGPLGRESLHMQAIRLDNQAERLAWLAEYLPRTEGSGIIYTLTKADAKRVSAWLAERGIDAPPYFSGVANRPELEDALRDNDVKALVATLALGMGFDKPDLSFVVHFQRPGSVISYYQQIGRAGRAINRAEVILLTGTEDDAIADYFIDGAFPPEEVLNDVLKVIEEGDGARMKELLAQVNTTEGTIKQALKTLEVEGAVTHSDSGWTRTLNAWQLDTERVERVTAARRAEQGQMAELVASDECLMSFVTRELDDPSAEACGRCANCVGPFVSTEVDAGLELEAIHFLKRSYQPIEPRKQWPAGPDGEGPKRNIPEHLRLQQGRALAIYGDAGWGRLVKQGKHGTGGFDEELVEAVAEMIESEWRPDPLPTWVTAVPSLRHPTLVPGFAESLAERLGLPYRTALEKQRETAPQKNMENSVQQARNAIGAFAALPEEVSADPVFLVDDMVDSRWSLTACGSALIDAGSGPVFPVVLGKTTKGSD